MPKTTSDSTISIGCGIRGLSSSPASGIRFMGSVFRQGWFARSEHEGEGDTDDRERLGEREAQDGDGLQSALGLGLTGDTADVGREDQTDTDAWADGGQTVADHVGGALDSHRKHVLFLSLFLLENRGGGQCSSDRAPEMYMAFSRVKT